MPELVILSFGVYDIGPEIGPEVSILSFGVEYSGPAVAILRF